MCKTEMNKLRKVAEALDKRLAWRIDSLVSDYEKVNERLKKERRNQKILNEKTKDEKVQEAEAQLKKLTDKIRAMEAQEAILERRSILLKERELECDMREGKIERRKTEIMQMMANLTMLEASLLSKTENMSISRLEVAELLPHIDDSDALKKAWFFLFNALRANGDAMEVWNPPERHILTDPNAPWQAIGHKRRGGRI